MRMRIGYKRRARGRRERLKRKPTERRHRGRAIDRRLAAGGGHRAGSEA